MKRLLTLTATLLLSAAVLAQQTAEPMRFRADGKFRIMQLTDLHYNNRPSDSAHLPGVLRSLIEASKPDLIVVTGDLIYSQPAEKLFREICGVIGEQGTPYAIALGNHDPEFGLDYKALYELIRTLPGCVNGRYNAPDERQGDFVIPILAANGQSEQARIYVMDSNDYNADKSYKGLTAEQVAWYRTQCADAKMRNGQAVNGLIFFHVPLNEYAEAFDTAPIAGFRNEKECPGRDNTGMFRAIVDGGEICGVFTGHDHASNYIAQKEGVALVYGRYSGSYGVYHELISGARLIEIEQGQRGFTTWERLVNGRERRKVSFPTEK